MLNGLKATENLCACGSCCYPKDAPESSQLPQCGSGAQFCVERYAES